MYKGEGGEGKKKCCHVLAPDRSLVAKANIKKKGGEKAHMYAS